MWFFFIGTAPTVPIMLIYCYFHPNETQYYIALLVCFGITLATLLLVYANTPPNDPDHAEGPVNNTILTIHDDIIY